MCKTGRNGENRASCWDRREDRRGRSSGRRARVKQHRVPRAGPGHSRERTGPAPSSRRPAAVGTCACGRTHHRIIAGPTCAAGGAGAAEGAEAALRGASHGGLTARAPALQPRGSPRRGSDPGASGRPLCAQRGARPDGAMVPEAVSVGCSKCPEATVRQRPPPASPFLERKPKSCRPCLPRRGRDRRKVLRTRHVSGLAHRTPLPWEPRSASRVSTRQEHRPGSLRSSGSRPCHFGPTWRSVEITAYP